MHHHVRKETLQITVDSEALAFEVQPRLQNLNRTAFLPIIERVFDERSFADRRMFIERLEIDLGTVWRAESDQEIAARFERKLREALQVAIDRIEHRPSGRERVQADESAQLEILERYLVTGTLPFWVPATTFDLEEWIVRLSASAPDGLIDLFRRRRFDAAVLERMTSQIGEASVRRLFRPLDQADGAGVHERSRTDPRPFIEPLRQVDTSDEESLHELYRTGRPALVALLRDTRERLAVARFLLRLDQADLADLVRQLVREIADQAAADEARGSLDASADRQFPLERAVEKIPAPGRISPPSDEIDEARLRHLYRTDRPALVALLRRLFGDEPLQWPLQKLNELGGDWIRDLYRMDRHALVGLVRDRRERLLVERFLLRLDRAALEDLVRQLSPENADQIAADVAEVASMPNIYRQAGPSQALRHLWLVTADVRLRTLDRPYERRAFVKAVLAAFAESVGETANDFLTAVSEDWTVLNEPEGEGVPAARSLRSLAQMFARYDLSDAFQYYLRHGVLPYSVSLLRPELTVADALDVLPDLPLRSLQAMLADLEMDARVRAWRRVVRQQPPQQVTRFISALIDRIGLRAERARALLSKPAADAADQTGVYARLIVSLIDGEPTGTAPETTPGIGAPEDIGQALSEADRIKAVLSSRARGTAAADERTPTSLRLLLSLIDRDVDDARRFLLASKHAGVAPSALVDEAPSEETVKTIQKLLSAEAARRLTLMLEFLAELPPADRPTDELVYSVVATEIVEHPSGSQREEIFFERVLDRLARTPRGRTRDDAPAAVSSSPPPSVADALVDALRLTIEPAPGQEKKEPAAPPRADVEPSEWLWRLGLFPEADSSLSAPDEASRHALLRAIDESPEVVHGALVDRIGDREIRERWARTLSEPELVRIAYVLEPRLHRALMEAAELLFSAWLRAAPDGSAQARRVAFWSFVLGFLADTRTAERSLDRLVEDFFEIFGDAARDAGVFPADERPERDLSGRETARPAWVEELLEAVLERASATGSAAVRAIVERDRASLTATFPRRRRAEPLGPTDTASEGRHDTSLKTAPRSAPIRLAFGMAEDRADDASAEPIYIANAGLVLTNPFLPRWFQALDLLEDVESGKTRLRPDRISRAVHLLQWLVDRSAATPEPMLCLNKLLCGAALAVPVERRIEPTENEIDACQMLLKSMLANWTSLSGTSIEGLQETFLQREGRLERTSDGWRLLVQRKTVDVLLDQIPWSISTVFHSWMPEPIFVTW